MAHLPSQSLAHLQGPNGTGYPGAQLYVYLTGTTTPAPVYQDANLDIAHTNPVLADGNGFLPPIFLDPAITYRLVGRTSSGVAIPGMSLDPISATASGGLRFSQTGDGAVVRTINAKLCDVSSVRDFGAVGDGRTQDQVAFTEAAAALAHGGPIEVTPGTHLVGEQILGPSRGNVHAYDYAVVGTKNIVGNNNFMGNPASGWTLSNFISNNPGVSHTAGSVARARCSVKISKYTTYLISVTLKTSKVGGIAFFLNNDPVFTIGDHSILPAGTDTYHFAMFSYTVDGVVNFELRSDTAWAGSISDLSVVKVEREAPYDFFSIASDKKDFDNILGIKFGRFLSGNIGIGDRLTSSLLSYKAVWNVALGSRALSTNINGLENTAIGAFTLEYNQVDRNTAGGYSAFRYNTKGTHNTGWGYKTFGRNSIGSNNTGVGFWASLYNQTGGDNSSFGAQANYYNCNGNGNSAFGSQAGLQNDGGNSNTYIGAISGPYTPGPGTFSYHFSTCVGAESKGYGNNTTSIGFQARCGSDPNTGGTAITVAATAFGYRAVAAKDSSVAIGGEAVASEIRGTAVGDGSKVTGQNGTAIGYLAQAAENCTSIGSQSGINLTGKNNISIGHGSNNFEYSNNYNNVISIGFDATCSADNQITLGNNVIDTIRAAVTTITAISDRRDKKNITYIDEIFASNFIKSLFPARWEWDMRGDVKREGGDAGFIAQDLLQAQTMHDADWLRLVNVSNPDRLEATPGNLLPVLVAALKNALERIEVLENRSHPSPKP